MTWNGNVGRPNYTAIDVDSTHAEPPPPIYASPLRATFDDRNVAVEVACQRASDACLVTNVDAIPRPSQWTVGGSRPPIGDAGGAGTNGMWRIRRGAKLTVHIRYSRLSLGGKPGSFYWGRTKRALVGLLVCDTASPRCNKRWLGTPEGAENEIGVKKVVAVSA
jgi:hypothetical protein